jgi:hypothetical protein
MDTGGDETSELDRTGEEDRLNHIGKVSARLFQYAAAQMQEHHGGRHCE